MGRSAMLAQPMPRQPEPLTIRCTACEHWCVLRPGETGKCGVRRNASGELDLLVYGRAAAAHVDPVEKKPLYHFLPGREILSIGTYGCGFRCAFCQNWSLSQTRFEGGEVDPDSLGEKLPPDRIVEACLDSEIPMIAFTYNEPAVFFEYAFDTCRLARQAGLRTVFVSSGFETRQALETIVPHLDAINVDLKSFRDGFYRKWCGARLAPVLRTIEHLVRESPVWTEVTTLVIPGLNDDPKELAEAAAFLFELSPDLPWHLSAFHPDYRMRDVPPTPATTLVRAWETGKAAGLRYVYLGNLRDPERESTFCPSCGQLTIARNGYWTQPTWKLPGVCPDCGKELAGVWQ
ncbi:MAG: AmmeMemoRadiSam system radical SAM enzyme [Actinomycetota bacterium]